jgi:hypothetical protein
VVLNVLLAWPDCCFRSETVVHPRTRNTLAFVPAQFNELEVMPKERELIEICKQEKAAVARRWSIRSTPARATPRRA